ncbi:MAG: BamA/TamA family outer membrane protein [Bacteroidetes bacterium]|nr:BamA/TamA family outer membrane protein [Bacteroidota bacterium]
MATSKKIRQANLLLAALLAGCLLFFSIKTSAQTSFHLQLKPLDHDSVFLKKLVQFQTSFKDTTLIFNELKNIRSQLHALAHLEASIDSTARQDSAFTAWLHIGPAYEWASLANGNVDADFLDRSGFRQRLFDGKPLRFTDILKMQERLLEQAENNGFPFAAVRLDSLQFDSSTVGSWQPGSPAARNPKSEIRNLKSPMSAKIFLDKGRLVFFDSLNVEGDVKISKNYLSNYLGIRQGELYSRRKVLKIRDRLRELPFLKEKSNALVSFLDDRASVRLFLEKKKASRFDFLLGLLPDNGRAEQKLLITGTFNAEFQNQFGLGERIYAAFERLRPQTQRLEVAFAYPYMLQLPFGVDLKFNQYKRDSTYTDIIGEFGVQYLFEGGNYLKAFWNTTASNLLSVDTVAIRQGRFPAQLDVKNSAFGLEASWQALDYRFNPRKGWSVLLKGSAGTRQIQRNQAILNVAENFYDTLPGRTFRFVLDGKVERYFPLMQRSAVKLAARSGAIISEEKIYGNEQYRIGGNRLLRGFDEESVFATFFSVFSLEYRLLLGQNSYFYTFGDYGYAEDRRIGQTDRFDRLFGFGGGLTFETTAGVFGISLAVGKSEGVPFDFRNPKVHFGYVSVF